MPALAVVLASLGLLGVACSGGSGPVSLDWRSTQTSGPVAQASQDGAQLETVVIVRNESSETIRGASLIFRPSEALGAPLGFSVGTITSVPTLFEGSAHVWRLGDIAPGTRVVFNLGLWFSAGQFDASPTEIELLVELVSERSETLLPSSNLTVRF